MTDDPWDKLIGLRCSCPPDCTDTRWGNGPRDCDPKCRPCQIMAGEPYVSRDKIAAAKRAATGPSTSES